MKKASLVDLVGDVMPREEEDPDEDEDEAVADVGLSKRGDPADVMLREAEDADEEEADEVGELDPSPGDVGVLYFGPLGVPLLNRT